MVTMDGSGLDVLLDLAADLVDLHAQVLQDVGSDATPLLDQPQEDVLGSDEVVVEALRLFTGQRHHLPRTVREAVKHGFLP
jgi:hypothetical protein